MNDELSNLGTMDSVGGTSMFDGSNFLNGILGLIDGLLAFYLIIILARIIVSWVNPDPYNRLVQILCGLTDPALNAVRRRLPSFFWSAGLDFTPLVLVLLIQVARLFLGNLHL
jgi:YggT family protein|tara:strand:- start:4750 stop:5088 length:339 start_codon:yes stop_codon:yes gene_type:complete